MKKKAIFVFATLALLACAESPAIMEPVSSAVEPGGPGFAGAAVEATDADRPCPFEVLVGDDGHDVTVGDCRAITLTRDGRGDGLPRVLASTSEPRLRVVYPSERRGEPIRFVATVLDDAEIRAWSWFRVKKHYSQGSWDYTEESGSSTAVWMPPLSFRDSWPFNVRVRAYHGPGADDYYEVTTQILFANTPPTAKPRKPVYDVPIWHIHSVAEHGWPFVRLVAEVCDRDDPIWFDRNTGECGGSSRKPRSYLHDDANYIWYYSSGIRCGTALPTAPWLLDCWLDTPAHVGDTFTATMVLYDPDGGSASATFVIRVVD